jgi:hypothetical protein
MLTASEMRKRLEDSRGRSTVCGGIFDVDTRRRRDHGTRDAHGRAGFLGTADEAQKTVAELKRAKRTVDDWYARDQALSPLASSSISRRARTTPQCCRNWRAS